MIPDLLKRVRQNLQIRLRPSWQAPEVAALYAVAAQQARRAAFYRQGGVPDTLDGRFDLLTLHLVLLMRRLAAQGREAEVMRQYLFDFFAADMDRNLREMGVGDMGISRRVKAMGQAFYGRMAAYDRALREKMPPRRRAALMTALDRNLYGTVPTAPESLGWMADYALLASADLDRQALASMLRGEARFPAPEETRNEPEQQE